MFGIWKQTSIAKDTEKYELTPLGYVFFCDYLQASHAWSSNSRIYTRPLALVQGDTKKTVITKNRITSKIFFRLTQNFSYIRSNLCSRHLQSFKSVLQKLFVSLALKKCAPNELPGATGTFGSGGQSSRWPSRIPPLVSLLLLLWLLPSGQG